MYSIIFIYFIFFFFRNRLIIFFFFFSSRRRHTRSTRDWSSDVVLFRSPPVAQRVEQGGQDTGPAGADGVAEGDRAPVHVDLGRVQVELAADRHRLDRERL